VLVEGRDTAQPLQRHVTLAMLASALKERNLAVDARREYSAEYERELIARLTVQWQREPLYEAPGWWEVVYGIAANLHGPMYDEHYTISTDEAGRLVVAQADPEARGPAAATSARMLLALGQALQQRGCRVTHMQYTTAHIHSPVMYLCQVEIRPAPAPPVANPVEPTDAWGTAAELATLLRHDLLDRRCIPAHVGISQDESIAWCNIYTDAGRQYRIIVEEFPRDQAN
jgi:hypothetical protein